MATTSFASIKDAPEPIETPAVAVNVAPAATAAPVAVAPAQDLTTHVNQSPAGIEGEIERSDIKLPRINLVQKMSDMVNAGFRPGDLVYNRELALDKPATVVVVKLKKQYQQDLPYGGDEMPHVCDTLAEVREAGGSVEWGAENHYSELAHLQLLVKAPADLHDEHIDLFPYMIGGESWAPAMFTVAKSAYKSAGKPVITAAFSSLRNGLHHGLWQLTSEGKKNAMGSWDVPVMKLSGKTSPELAELVAALNASA